MQTKVLLSILALGPGVVGRPTPPWKRANHCVNPVLAANFPDPALVVVDETWYAFATSGNGVNIQIAVSPSFTDHDWKLLDGVDPLPDPGSWAVNNGNVWAPMVIQLNDGRYVMYYAAPSKLDPDKHCVGAAVSNAPVGPYLPWNEPVACPLEQGGAIDPAAFLDPKSGNLYVAYKVDGNSLNTGTGACKANKANETGAYHPTPIMLQRVDPANGVNKIGDPVKLLDRDDADGPLVEAPSLFFNEDSNLYFMTFSSNCYSTPLYDISFAFSTYLEQEFTKSEYPLMTSFSLPVIAPGGAAVTFDGKYALYHGTVSWDSDGNPVRYLYAAVAHQDGEDMLAVPLS